MNSLGTASIKPDLMSGWSGGVSERAVSGSTAGIRRRKANGKWQMARVGRRKFATRQDQAKLVPAPNLRVRPRLCQNVFLNRYDLLIRYRR